MHGVQTIAIDDPVLWASLSVMWATILILYQMAPLRRGCYYSPLATGFYSKHGCVLCTAKSCLSL